MNPAGTADRLPVIVNQSGGTAAAQGADLRQQLEAAFAGGTPQADIRLLDGEALGDEIAQQAGAPKVVVGGGDGTIACAAAALAGTPTVLALLPLGTLNHLARDLGIPGDLEQAAALARNGSPNAIDLGNVNGCRFVNNASIGLYPSLVNLREEYRKLLRLPKWLATLPAAWQVFLQLKQHRLTVDLGDGRQPVATPLLFVGNNIYSLESGEVGTRASLSDGRLSVFIVRPRSHLAMVWFGLRAALGRASHHADFILLGECTQLKITAPHASIDVGLDGEVCRLDFPLEFSIEPGALRVICPPDLASGKAPGL